MPKMQAEPAVAVGAAARRPCHQLLLQVLVSCEILHQAEAAEEEQHRQKPEFVG